MRSQKDQCQHTPTLEEVFMLASSTKVVNKQQTGATPINRLMMKDNTQKELLRASMCRSTKTASSKLSRCCRCSNRAAIISTALITRTLSWATLPPLILLPFRTISMIKFSLLDLSTTCLSRCRTHGFQAKRHGQGILKLTIRSM